MIAVVDSWARTPPPPGAADDDDLFLATGADAAIVIGDRLGLLRAQAMGINVISHRAIREPLGTMARLRLRRGFPRRPDLCPMSIWTAGVVNAPIKLPAAPNPRLAQAAASRRPFIVPIASSPRDIDAFALTHAAALLDAAGFDCVMGLPTCSSHLARARRLLCNADRAIAGEALPGPATADPHSADMLLDVGVRPGGPIDRYCDELGGNRIDARGSQTPMSFAIAIKQALPVEVPR